MIVRGQHLPDHINRTSMPCVLRYCVLPKLLGLETLLSLVKVRQNFKYDIAEKFLSLLPRQKERGQERCLFISRVWHCQPLELTSHAFSGPGLQNEGLLCSTRRCKNKHGQHPRYQTARNVLKVRKVKYYFQLSLSTRINLNSKELQSLSKNGITYPSTKQVAVL